MKPNFALSFSHDAISLLMRAKGGWRSVGEAALDDPDLADRLRILRASAVEMSGSQFATKLVIPNSQLLYRDILAPGDTPGARRVAIRQALEGATPYPLDELAFDWSDAGNGMAKVVVVAHVTLEEAENFAVEHRFNPVSFTAIPQPGDFTGEPWFGTTRLAKGLLTNGAALERDEEAIVVIGPAKQAEATSDDVSDLAGDQAAGPDVQDKAEDPPENTGPEDDDATTHAEAEDDQPHVDAEDDQPHVAAMAGTVFKKPDPASAVASMAFSTRRLAAEPPAAALADGATPSAPVQAEQSNAAIARPLILESVAPRIALMPDLAGADEPDALPKLVPETRKAEVTHLSVNAGDVAEDDRKTEKPAVQMPPPKPVLPPLTAPPAKPQSNGKAPSIQITPRPDRVPAPVRTTSRATGEELGVFGTRKPQPARRKPRYLGLVLTLALILALAAAALISNLIMGDTIVSRLFAPASEPAIETFESTDETAALQDPAPEDTLLSPDGLASDGPVVTKPVSPEVAAAMHAETGIWPLAPIAPIDPDGDRLDDLYIASIDPVVVGHDAIALPAQEAALTDNQVIPGRAPAPAGTSFDRDESGFVRATPEGAMTPDGILVYAGKPALVPAPRPGGAETALPALAEQPPDRLAGFRPRARPGDLVEQNERSRLGGRTRSQLATLRPSPRPDSAQEQVVEAPPTKLAVLTSRTPQSRPNGFAAIVEKALAEAQASAPPEPAEDTTVVATAAVAAPQMPSVPTRASVAQEATIKNVINLREINLIGVYGSSSNRRALIRLSSGKYVKVQVGDRIDGGQVAAISSSELLYVKGGRKVTLSMPNG